MVVKLLRWTPDPVRLVAFSYKIMKERITEADLEMIGYEEATWLIRELIKDKLNTQLEFVSTVWYFDEVSRAFQQQLTRHRQFAYSIQSLRVVDKKDFALKEQYLIPDDCKNLSQYMHVMRKIQQYYQELLAGGESAQVARGVLPLNIFSPILMVANMRGLLHMFEQRMCHQVQGEFRQVVLQMMKEIEEKISPVFVEHLAEPCVMGGKCMISVENELRIQGKDVLNRAPCSLYKKVRKEKR